MPVRKIGMSSRSVTWDFRSVKTNSTHRCESTLEFEFLYLVEFDPLVKTFELQPVSIPFINHNGRKTKYTPDVKVIYTQKGALQRGHKFSLIEVKYSDELEAKWSEFVPKFKVAENYCEAEGGKFEIFNEHKIQTQRLANYKFLHRYLDPNEVPKLNFDFLRLARDLKTFTPNDWVDRIEGSKLVKGQAVSNLWHHVATDILEIDLDTPITMTSKIRIKEN